MSKFNLQFSAVSIDTDCAYEGDHDLFLASSDKEVSDYCVNAINNHDRLVEENKRLRDLLLQIRGFKSQIDEGVNVHGGMSGLLGSIDMIGEILRDLEAKK